MRCHYVVMGLEKASTADDIKKTYRKLAIKLHPDKNLGNSDAAAELFKELAAAYECLSDPRERKWYDEHRIEILRGDDPDSDSSSDSDGDVAGKRGKTKLKKREVNLWPYFSSACYEGFDSDSGDSSFYAVYARAFAAVDGAEGDGWVAAPFGDGWAAWDVVKRFYDTYGDFQSTRTFASYDKWHVGGEESRYVRRA
ncbi:DnaJ domain-containing protein, partial [Pelagophyceae sp. CCMP2097]